MVKGLPDFVTPTVPEELSAANCHTKTSEVVDTERPFEKEHDWRTKITARQGNTTKTLTIDRGLVFMCYPLE